MVGIVNGSFGGVAPPLFLSGKVYIPHWMFSSGGTATVVANQIMYIPYFVPRTTTFAGAKAYNQGAGDNGKKMRIAVYGEAAAGGPGALLKDFGEITLTAASAERTLANSVTLSGPAWVYLACNFDTTPAMFAMRPSFFSSNVGISTGLNFGHQFGSFGLQVSTTALSNMPGVDYVASAYGAFASTAVTPTATDAIGTGAGDIPVMGLYV